MVINNPLGEKNTYLLIHFSNLYQVPWMWWYIQSGTFKGEELSRSASVSVPLTAAFTCCRVPARINSHASVDCGLLTPFAFASKASLWNLRSSVTWYPVSSGSLVSVALADFLTLCLIKQVVQGKTLIYFIFAYLKEMEYLLLDRTQMPKSLVKGRERKQETQRKRERENERAQQIIIICLWLKSLFALLFSTPFFFPPTNRLWNAAFPKSRHVSRYFQVGVSCL